MPFMSTLNNNGITKAEMEEIMKKNQKEMIDILRKDDEFIMKIASSVSKLLEKSEKNEPVMEYLDEQRTNYYRDPNL